MFPNTPLWAMMATEPRVEGDVQDFDGGQLVFRVDDAHAVGPEEAHAESRATSRSSSCRFFPSSPVSAKPRAFHDDRPDPFAPQIDQYFLDVRRRDDDDRQVDPFRKIGYGRIDFLPLNFTPLGIYQEGLFQPASLFPEKRNPEPEPR